MEHWGVLCPGATLLAHMGTAKLSLAICPCGMCAAHHTAGQRLLFHSSAAMVLPLPKHVLTHAELLVSTGMMVDEEPAKTEGIS